ncbi:uncharacterized protein EDB93DRAFT_1246113 [Suillus bovinus]|uniref:uncharacterized protein n=1 Tax=Suillus bovinus TaxID=48563 RepID=UPI001B8769BE|nr:uncharacterized protein EDB93DRAFT_1246113 [Suillus bovinus]KAG2158262.1 hypothetical protein EDB93DRAFT_1246113 [Suillus bovinus]
MSTSVDTSLTGIKEITAKIMAIITGTRQLPPGHSHFSLTTQVSTLCGPIPVDLPPSPVIAGPSTNPASESREKGKGKAVVQDPGTGSGRESEEEVSNDSSTSLPTPEVHYEDSEAGKDQLALPNSRCLLSRKTEEDSVTQLISHGVPEVVLPWLSPDVARTSGSPRSPQSLKKKPFGPAMAIASKHPEVIEPPQATPEPLVEAPPVTDAGDILIPGPNNPCQACHKMEWPCATRFDKRTGALCMSCIYCTTKKIKCISVNPSPRPPGGPDPGPLPKLPPKLQLPRNPPARRGVAMVALGLKPPIPLGSNALALQVVRFLLSPAGINSLQWSQSRVSSVTPGPSGAQTPKAQTHGCSKTVTAAKEPTPAPAPVPSSTSRVPCSALDVPMPDLHAMAMAIREGAAQITALEERVVEQDAKIDTLQRLHEGL